MNTSTTPSTALMAGVRTFLALMTSVLLLESCMVEDEYMDDIPHEWDEEEQQPVYDEPDSTSENMPDGASLLINGNAQRLSIPLTTGQETLVKEGNAFTLKLLADVADKADKADNLLLSPLSLQMALGMLAGGLSDAAFEEMASTIYHHGVTPDELNTFFSALYDPLTNASDGSICRLAQSAWVQSGYAIQPAFLLTLAQCCNARVSYVDFVGHPDEAGAYMNAWASEMTDGMIPELSIPINHLTRMVLLNATLLRTAWTDPFIVTDDKQSFTSATGEKHDVTMMRTGMSGATQNNYYTRVIKSYGNGTFVMSLYLPHQSYSVLDIIPHLFDDGSWQDANVTVTLPKFEYRNSNDFIPSMQHLGIRRLFDDADALAGINEELAIGQILQDTYINVNERGTEAAAVTEIEVNEGSAAEDLELELDFNRPFVYTISETSTGVLLFAGCVNAL